MKTSEAILQAGPSVKGSGLFSEEAVVRVNATFASTVSLARQENDAATSPVSKPSISLLKRAEKIAHRIHHLEEELKAILLQGRLPEKSGKRRSKIPSHVR
jgi:hypothetical protein